MRAMTNAERELLIRLAEALRPQTRVTLLRQIEVASVRAEDPGHLSFAVTAGDDTLRADGVDVIETSYRDTDGGLVEILLHFEQPGGTMSLARVVPLRRPTAEFSLVSRSAKLPDCALDAVVKSRL